MNSLGSWRLNFPVFRSTVPIQEVKQPYVLVKLLGCHECLTLGHRQHVGDSFESSDRGANISADSFARFDGLLHEGNDGLFGEFPGLIGFVDRPSAAIVN
jgi:hypothetical protein